MKMLYVSSQVRPDVANAIGLLTRVQAWPSPSLLKHAERVWIYLHGTASLGLYYTAGDVTTAGGRATSSARSAITAGGAPGAMSVATGMRVVKMPRGSLE